MLFLEKGIPTRHLQAFRMFIYRASLSKISHKIYNIKDHALPMESNFLPLLNKISKSGDYTNNNSDEKLEIN